MWGINAISIYILVAYNIPPLLLAEREANEFYGPLHNEIFFQTN
jgi:hypothetical protein